jgi:hypothetical protein
MKTCRRIDVSHQQPGGQNQRLNEKILRPSFQLTMWLRLRNGRTKLDNNYSSGPSAAYGSFCVCSNFINLFELVPLVGSAASGVGSVGIAGVSEPSLHTKRARMDCGHGIIVIGEILRCQRQLSRS